MVGKHSEAELAEDWTEQEWTDISFKKYIRSMKSWSSKYIPPAPFCVSSAAS